MSTLYVKLISNRLHSIIYIAVTTIVVEVIKERVVEYK